MTFGFWTLEREKADTMGDHRLINEAVTAVGEKKAKHVFFFSGQNVIGPINRCGSR